MKRKKTKIIVILIFAVIISCINIGIKKVNAENTTILYGNTVKAIAGKEVKIPVLIKNNRGVTGLGLKVTYDSNVMTPVKVEKGKVLSGLSNLQFGDTISTSTEDGVLECVAFNDSNFSGNGELLILTFQISASVSAGSYKLDLGLNEHYDESFEDIPIVCENILVTVSKNGNNTSTPGIQTPIPTPTEDVLDDFHVYLGYTNNSWTESFFHQDKPGIIISGDGNYTFSYTIQETNTDIHTLLLETDLDYYDVVDRLRITPTKLDCGGKYYDIQDYCIAYELQENGRYAYRILIRNPYVENFEGLGGAIIPVTAGDVISIDFTVAGMGKKANVQPTNVPVTTPNVSLDSSDAATTVQAMVGSSDTTKQSTTNHTLIKKPGKVTGLDLSYEGKKLFVSWNWKSNVSGFQIQYAQNKKFTKKKKIKNTGKYAQDKTIRGIKKGNTYYVRIRAYNKSSGKKVYGKWSKVKKVKTK